MAELQGSLQLVSADMKTINGDILLTKNLHADKSEFQNQMVDGEKLTGDIHPTT